MAIRDVIGLACLIMLFHSCIYERLEDDLKECNAPVTYNSHIKTIIDTHCAVSGCHVQGFLPGDYTSYAVLKEKADAGKIRLFVFELRNMPPAGSLSLSDEEYALLDCWLKQNAKE